MKISSLVSALLTLFTISAFAADQRNLLSLPMEELLARPQPAIRAPEMNFNLSPDERHFLLTIEPASYGPRTPVRAFLTEDYFRRIEILGRKSMHYRPHMKFREWLASAGLPANLTEGEIQLLETNPEHPLFAPIMEVPFDRQLTAWTLGSAGIFYVIDGVKLLNSPRGLLSVGGFGPVRSSIFRDAIQRYLAKANNPNMIALPPAQPTCAELLSTHDLITELRLRGYSVIKNP